MSTRMIRNLRRLAFCLIAMSFLMAACSSGHPGLGGADAESTPLPSPSDAGTQPFNPTTSPGAPTPRPVPLQLETVVFVNKLEGWVLSTRPGCQADLSGPSPCAEVLATTDGGKTWAMQMGSKNPLSGLDFLNPQDGWAYGAHSLYVTTNGGKKWTLQWHSLAPQGSYQFVTPQIGWAIGGVCPGPNQPCRNRLLVSRDAGAVWTPVTIDGLVPAGISFLDSSVGWAAAYPSHGQDGGQPWPLELLGTGNGGKTWSPLAQLTKAAGQPGVMQSWASRSAGWALVTDLSTCSMGGCWGMLFSTTDGGATWHKLQGTNNWHFAQSAKNEAAGFGQAGFPGGLRFINRTVGWLSVERGAGGTGLGGVARTQDGGRTWMNLLQGSDISIRSMSVLSASEAWFVGADELTGGNPSYLLHTQDAGGTWTKITSGQILPGSAKTG